MLVANQQLGAHDLDDLADLGVERPIRCSTGTV